MKKKPAKSSPPSPLRHLAKRHRADHAPTAISPATPADMQRLIHQLQVHQIELEMQNDELRQTRAEVEAGLARYVDLYDFAPVGYLTLDREGTIRQINLSGSRLLGMERSRLAGNRLASHIHTEHRPIYDAFIQKALAGQADPSCEVRLIPSANLLRHVRLEAALGQDPQTCRLTMTDITERKQADEQRDQARSAAEAATQAKDHFIATLSHELRTPITPAMLTLDSILSDPALPPHLRDDVALVRHNLTLEVRLIDDLLDLNRIARGKIELHLRHLDLHAKLASVMEICRADAHDKQLKLQLDLHAIRHHVDGDAGRLLQVFWNLLKNAIKFTPVGGAIIVRTSNPQPNIIRVDVADTGIGLNPQDIPRLFAPFAQGNREVTRQFGGLGLGLAICNNLVKLHGGSIHAHSKGVNRGATFTVELPAITLAHAQDHLPAAHSPHAAAKSPSLRLLLVEDQADTLRILSRLLRSSGHHVTTANCVAEALQVADKADGNFDLVLSDLGLPDGSGLDLMQTLRDRWKLRGIAISGYGMDEDKALSRAAGFIDHLTKPIQIEVLEETLARSQSLPKAR